MWRSKDTKQTKNSGKLAAISAGLLVLLISFVMNSFSGSSMPAMKAAAGLPAATRFASPQAQPDDSTKSLGSAARRGQSISLMIFRLN